MTKVAIREISDENDLSLGQVKRLFELMYDEMSSQGLIIPLAKDGAEIWIESVKKMINRLGVLFIAVQDEKVIAFANGIIRYAPDYLGSLKIGSITHVYVSPENRNTKIGYELVEKLENWFLNKKVSSVELQVIFNNLKGIGFWKHCGFKEELIQFRKKINNV